MWSIKTPALFRVTAQLKTDAFDFTVNFEVFEVFRDVGFYLV